MTVRIDSKEAPVAAAHADEGPRTPRERAAPHLSFRPDSDTKWVFGNTCNRKTGNTVSCWPVLTAPRHHASLSQRLGILPTCPCCLLLLFPQGNLGALLSAFRLDKNTSPSPSPPSEHSHSLNQQLPGEQQGDTAQHRPLRGDRAHDLLPGTLRSCPNSSHPRPESRNTMSPKETPVLPRFLSLSSSR